MKLKVFFLCLLQFLNVRFSFGLSCKDENNNDVDWFIIYKLPKLQNEPKGSLLRSGSAYAYLTPLSKDPWTLSSISIESERSMLGKTWNAFDSSKKVISHLFYNDDPPIDKGRANGHLKGFFAFDSISGFWLSHSIPRFGQVDKYEYPISGLNNGQHAICITLKPSELNDICHHLLYCHPKIYSSYLSALGQTFLDTKAKTLFAKTPSFIKNSPFTRKAFIESRGKEKFLILAKDNQLAADFYSGILAPELRTSLIASTWRRGSGTNLEPTCTTNFTILHVSEINMKPLNSGRTITFSSSEDHSKWAISVDKGHNWICLADLNRMESQEKRGGGAICFESFFVWKAFRNLISDTDQCPI